MLIKTTDKTSVMDFALKSDTFFLLKEAYDKNIITNLRVTSTLLKRELIYELINNKLQSSNGIDVAVILIFNDINCTNRFWVALYNEFVLFLGCVLEHKDLEDGHFPCKVSMALELKDRYSLPISHVIKEIERIYIKPLMG